MKTIQMDVSVLTPGLGRRSSNGCMAPTDVACLCPLTVARIRSPASLRTSCGGGSDDVTGSTSRCTTRRRLAPRRSANVPDQALVGEAPEEYRVHNLKEE